MNDDIHALSGAYAVDAVDDVERVRFEHHLAGCEACQAEVASLRAAAAELSALSDDGPPASLKSRVMADIRTVRPLPPVVAREAVPEPAGAGAGAGTGVGPGEAAGAGRSGSVVAMTRPRRRVWQGLVAAAAALVLVVAGVSVWRASTTDPGRAVADQVLAAPDATRTTQTLPSGARATVVRSESLHRAVLVTDGLAAAPEGRVYQLWLQDPEGRFASAGLVPEDGGADQVVVLTGDASRSAGAGITLEPAGGSPQPTTKPLALFAFA